MYFWLAAGICALVIVAVFFVNAGRDRVEALDRDAFCIHCPLCGERAPRLYQCQDEGDSWLDEKPCEIRGCAKCLWHGGRHYGDGYGYYCSWHGNRAETAFSRQASHSLKLSRERFERDRERAEQDLQHERYMAERGLSRPAEPQWVKEMDADFERSRRESDREWARWEREFDRDMERAFPAHSMGWRESPDYIPAGLAWFDEFFGTEIFTRRPR